MIRNRGEAGKMMRRKNKRNGFTLIELLAVMAIMSILVGVLLAAVQKVRQHSVKVKARSDVAQIVTAWLAYLESYRKFPGTGITSMGSNAVAILSGTVSSDNPRGEVFMEFNVNATNYVDPWNREYRVLLDDDYDNMIAGLPGVVGLANVSVAVWSAGYDGSNGTPDDVRNWQK